MATTNTPVPDILDVAVQRKGFLRRLLDGPHEKPALTEELDVSRSTVDRATSKLETVNLIEAGDDGYCTTSVGNVVATGFFDLMDTVEAANHEHGYGSGDTSGQAMLEAVLRRLALLESLLEEPKDKRMLVDEIGVSRATADRSVRELETVGLIEYADGRFALTDSGELTVSGVFDLIDTLKLRRQLNPFLKWISDGELDIDLELLADAELLVAEPGDPWAMINRHIQLIKTMDNSRALLPFTGLHAQEAAHQQIVQHDAGGELVVEPEIAEVHMSNPAYADLTEDIVETGRFDYFEYPEKLPYALAVIDETVQIVVSEGDEPRALLETDSPEVRDWADRTYEEYKQQAEKIT